MRALYRVWQFGQYLGARLGPEEQQTVETLLGPGLADLFRRMTPGEQAHSVRVMQTLIARGQTDRNLIVAALLHDVGKTRAPLRLWERIAVVLCRKAAPGLAERWGRAASEPRGLRRPFVFAQRHAAWGAEMAERAGAPARAVTLIRRHQTPPTAPPRSEEDRMIAALRQADEGS